MTIASLSYSPAEMFLNGESVDKVNAQSELYRLNTKTFGKYCQTLEDFYPHLLEALRTRKDSQFSYSQWTVLYKSMIHIFLVFLIDLETVKQAELVGKFTGDSVDIAPLYPQTQEALFQELPFSQSLRQQSLSLARDLLRGRELGEQKSFGLFQTFSPKNLSRYIIYKMTQPQIEVPQPSKEPKIAVVGAGAVLKHLSPDLKKRYEFIDIDSALHSFYHFPQRPNLAIRERLKKEVEQVLYTMNLPKCFSLFSSKERSSKFLAQLIVNLLPIQSIELFEKNSEQIQSLIKELKPQLVITSSGHHDDLSSLFISQAVEKKIPLITMQHGSGYCEYRSMQTERSIETCSYPTHYLSWGKGMEPVGKKNKTKVAPIGSPYLNAIPRHGFRTKKITTVLIPLEPIYFYQILDGFIPSQPGFIPDNYHVLIQTVEAIAKKYPSLRFIFKVKPGHERQYLVKRYLSKELVDRSNFTTKGKTLEYFNDHTLVLQPQLSGAFHEGLMAEIPFLLYLPSNQRFLKKEVDGFFDMLRENFMCGAKVNELVKAFDRQMNGKVAYQELVPHILKYQEWACVRNPKWEVSLRNLVSDLISKS